MWFVKIFGRSWTSVKQLLADFTIRQTTPNLTPIIVDPLLQPIGVFSKPILLVASTWNRLAGALVGDDEGEDREAEEKQDQQKHHEQVDPEQPRDAAAGSHQPRYRHQQHEHPQHDHRRVQKPLTLRIRLLRQPYPTGDDRNRQQQRYEVQDSHQIVTHAHHTSPLRVFVSENRLCNWVRECREIIVWNLGGDSR